MRTPKTLGGLAAAALIAAGAWWAQTPPAPNTATSFSTKDAQHALDTLTEKPRPERAMNGYDRDLFNVWASHPEMGRGCDTRAVLLDRTSTVAVQRNHRCTVKAGQWTDAYTGSDVKTTKRLDVDHMIPLAQAWRSGADTWSPQLRERFGNDLEHGNLVAADRTANQRKSDQDPADWTPNADRCGYVSDYVTTYAYWAEQARQEGHDLVMDRKEKDAITETLNHCT